MPNYDDLLDFLQNSRIEYFTHGGAGILYKIIKREGYISRIKSRDIKTFNQPVNCLLLKVYFLVPSGTHLESLSLYPSGSIANDINISTIPDYEFQEEIKHHTIIQKTAFKKYIQICPTLLYGKVCTKKDDNLDDKILYDLVLNNILDTLFTQYETKISKAVNYRRMKLLEYKTNEIGVLFMEYIENSYTPLQLLSSKKIKMSYEQYLDMIIKILHVHIELLLLGYFHTDWNFNNVLFILDDITHPLKLDHAILIDFYGCSYIKRDLEYVKFIHDQEYTKLLYELYKRYMIYPRRELQMNTYGYLVGFYDNYHNLDTSTYAPFALYGGADIVNHEIKTLVQSRKQKSNNNKKVLRAKTRKNNNMANMANMTNVLISNDNSNHNDNDNGNSSRPSIPAAASTTRKK